MPNNLDLSREGLFQVEQDDAWKREVRRETLRIIAATEGRTLRSSLVGWVVIGLAALALPNSVLFAIPMAIRLAVIAISRWGWMNFRRTLESGQPVTPALRILIVCLFTSGASWALIFLPIILDPMIHPARLVVGGGTLVALSLTTNVLGAIRPLVFGLVSGFVITFAIGMVFAPAFMGWAALISVLGLVLSFVAFAFATSEQQSRTAQMLVNNRRLSKELAKSLERAEFLSTRDPLTGLLNRRAFFEGENTAETTSDMRHLLTIDLDHFKLVNDSFGHDAGDQVLVATANILMDVSKNLPGGPHKVCRLGGEEFILLVSGVERAVACSTAELIRQNISLVAHGFESDDAPKVSASIGVASLAKSEHLDAALRRSDLAMYRAKDRGRNCVVEAVG